MQSSTTLRVARPTNDISVVSDFYVRGLGFHVLGGFKDHDGFDGIMIGKPGCEWHLEFTQQHGVSVGPAPTKEHLLVFYLPSEEDWAAAVARMEATGAVAVQSENPYWDHHGVTFEDPDGYRVVLQNAVWAA